LSRLVLAVAQKDRDCPRPGHDRSIATASGFRRRLSPVCASAYGRMGLGGGGAGGGAAPPPRTTPPPPRPSRPRCSSPALRSEPADRDVFLTSRLPLRPIFGMARGACARGYAIDGRWTGRAHATRRRLCAGC